MDEINKNIQLLLSRESGSDVGTSDFTVQLVSRPDTSDFYYLVILKADSGPVKGFILGPDLSIRQSAGMDQVPDLSKPPRVAELEKNTGTQVRLIWMPCEISFSPFYPFWEVRSDEKKVYVDLDNRFFLQAGSKRGG
jgi:hypothetical protein